MVERTDLLTQAYFFAAVKHKKQRRKGVEGIPYINHPIEVANLLAKTVGSEDLSLLLAAVLHDTLEDTKTSYAELASIFGEEVASVVRELTDDKSISKILRRKKQLESASKLTERARLIRIADKRCNILDMLQTRLEWTRKQKIEYMFWAQQVVFKCRGLNSNLDHEFDNAIQLAKLTLDFN